MQNKGTAACAAWRTTALKKLMSDDEEYEQDWSK